MQRSVILAILLITLQVGAEGQEASGEVQPSTGGASLLLQALQRGERDPTVHVRKPPAVTGESNGTNEDSLPEGGPRKAVRDGEKEQVRVKKVVDGGTLDLEDGRRIHLIGLKVPSPGGDPASGFSAEAARVFTKSMVEGSRIGLTYDHDRFDPLGRMVAYAWLPGDVSLNEMIIREGHARADLESNYRRDYKMVFRNAEQEAKANRRGLWGR